MSLIVNRADPISSIAMDRNTRLGHNSKIECAQTQRASRGILKELSLAVCTHVYACVVVEGEGGRAGFPDYSAQHVSCRGATLYGRKHSNSIELKEQAIIWATGQSRHLFRRLEADTAPHRLQHGLWLLMDLLLHVVLIATLHDVAHLDHQTSHHKTWKHYQIVSKVRAKIPLTQECSRPDPCERCLRKLATDKQPEAVAETNLTARSGE